MRTSLRSAGLLLVAALVTALPATAGAAARKITLKPNALSPSLTQQVDERDGILNAGNNVYFWAMLKLPAGAKITGLSYRRWAPSAGQTLVGVDRVQPGKSPSWQRIYEGSATDVSPAGSTWTIVNGTFVGPTRKVAAGWDYFVLTYTQPGVGIGDITVKYETP